MNEH